MAVEMKCRNCLYWKQARGESHGEVRFGHCHRFPPTPDPMATVDLHDDKKQSISHWTDKPSMSVRDIKNRIGYFGRFVAVSEDNYCGEWHLRPEKETDEQNSEV